MISKTDLDYIHSVMPQKIEGIRDVCSRKINGKPRVIRCAPVVRNKPFSTLYWLIDPEDVHAVSVLEATGYIEKIQAALNVFQELRKDLMKAHHSYQKKRQLYFSPEDRMQLEKLGLGDVFDKRGIGGMENFAAVKCLHLHFAHGLCDYNPVGIWVERNINRKAPEDPLQFYKSLYSIH